MDFLPIFINIKGQKCLVVGGGKVATRKTMLLLQAGGRVTIIAPRLDSALENITSCAESFHPDQLDGAALVIAATDDNTINQLVSQSAKSRYIPVNVVDHPGLCSFIMPAIVDRSPILIAISSSGKSPVLARLLRAHLETIIPQAYRRLAKNISPILRSGGYSGKKFFMAHLQKWYSQEKTRQRKIIWRIHYMVK